MSDHCCTLCGRRCRYARDVCSTCRVGTGLQAAGRPWRLMTTYPRAIRTAWSTEQLRSAHAGYERGLRDDLTVAMDAEYHRRRRLRRALRANEAAS